MPKKNYRHAFSHVDSGRVDKYGTPNWHIYETDDGKYSFRVWCRDEDNDKIPLFVRNQWVLLRDRRFLAKPIGWKVPRKDSIQDEIHPPQLEDPRSDVDGDQPARRREVREQ